MPSPSSLAQFLPRLYHVPDAGRLSPAVLADICVGPVSAAAPISSAARFSARPPPPRSGWAEVVLSVFRLRAVHRALRGGSRCQTCRKTPVLGWQSSA